MTRTVSALAGWFGSNRMLAHHVCATLEGCSWVGIPFAGGMSEVPHIAARTILVNDRHRHVVNLARVVADDSLRPHLVRWLSRQAFHPDVLRAAQEACYRQEPGDTPDLVLAQHYFVCCWMNRGGKAGIDDEFNGRPSVRWKSDGGDSMVRYRSALRGLATFSRALKRCTFETMDAFDFLQRCEDLPGYAIYADPPFPGVGRRYRHNAGQTEVEETAWHTHLRDALLRFERTRIVCRFYEHPLIRNLYPESTWHWRALLGGKTQCNDADQKPPEVLLVRNATPQQGGLFS